MDGVDDRSPGPGLFIRGKARLVQVALAVSGVGVDPFSDQQGEAAPGKSLVVGDHLLGHQPILSCADASHRGQGHAAGQLCGTDLQG